MKLRWIARVYEPEQTQQTAIHDVERTGLRRVHTVPHARGSKYYEAIAESQPDAILRLGVALNVTHDSQRRDELWE